ncbi:MAG: DUF938 domain-containing protein [Pseudomonadota bacterium]
MSGRLPPSASVATALEGRKMHAPAAERNAGALCELLTRHAPAEGRALELASGTGQHVTAFAKQLPALTWQPSEVDNDRIASIDAYVEEAGVENLKTAVMLDATTPGWADLSRRWDMIVLVNLLHLISDKEARCLIHEAVGALAHCGRFILYGPFMRSGRLTSDGDARFHAQLSASNPLIGYKDDTDVKAWLEGAGATHIAVEDMPANNLAFIATR